MSTHDYKEIFVEEAREQIDVLNDRLLILEKEPNNLTVINDIFRVAHTLKSSAAFVGLEDLSSFCHKLETLLQKVKGGGVVVSPSIMDILFASLDKIRDNIELFIDKDEIVKDFGNLPSELDKFISGVAVSGTSEVTPSTEEATDTEGGRWLSELKGAKKRGDKYYLAHIVFEKNIKMMWVRAELIHSNMERLGHVIICLPPYDDFKTDKLKGEVKAIVACDPKTGEKDVIANLDIDLVAEIRVNELTYEEVLRFNEGEESKAPKGVQQPKEEFKEAILEKEEKIVSSTREELLKNGEDKSVLTKSNTVRVPIKRLDELLNLVGELAITNSGFIEIARRFKQLLGNKEVVNEFEEKIDSLSSIATNLQESIMRSRMVPIGSVFSRFSRLVRDLSRTLAKEVNFSFRGEETELDKKIIDVIGEPLIHLIRNAIDHGLESVDVRKQLGKEGVGTILLDAYQRGNHIFVEVSDDGKGLDKDKILSKAIETQAISDEDSSSMTENDIYNMIFLPGFSTKTDVTTISGRGVGMDVVADTVKKLNGTISVRSALGRGSKFILSFPLTLAIVPAILVECGVETYAIPLSSVVETIKVRHFDIKTIDFNDVIHLRGNVIPLLHLNDIFDIQHSDNGLIPIIVSDLGDKHIGIVVDKLLGKREIVIKALSQNYQEVRGISGATILGNGQIALILDVPTLIDYGKTVSYKKKLGSGDKCAIDSDRKIDNIMLSDTLKALDDEERLKGILRNFDLDIDSYHLINELIKAALAISSFNIKRFLKKDVLLAVPGVNVYTYDIIKTDMKFTGDADMYFASCKLHGELDGRVVIALGEDSMVRLFRDLIDDNSMLSAMGRSSIMEICNLLTAGITNTINRALKIKVLPMAPTFYYESYSSYFHRLIEEHTKDNNYIWTIDTDIIVESMIIEGRIFFIPYDESFRVIGKAVASLR